MKPFYSLALMAALTLAVAEPLQAADKLRVVATLPDLAAVAEFIAGKHAQIETLARPGEDPHFVDPRPSFIRVLNRADLLIEGGADVEAGWLPPLAQNARNAKIQRGQAGRVVAGEGLQLLDVPAVLDRAQGDVHPFGNPHFMLDPKLAAQAAETIAKGLARVDSAHAAEYQAQAGVFRKMAEDRLKEWEKQLAPCKGQKVITYHKSFDYLLNRFGIELADTIEPKPGIEPSPSHVTHLIQRAKEDGVKVILAESFRPHRTGERIAKETGAAYIPLPLSPENQDYFAWMDEVVKSVAAACKGRE